MKTLLEYIRRSGLLLCCCVFTTMHLHAQDTSWMDMQQLCKKYSKISALAFDAEFKTYGAALPVKVTEQLNAHCVIWKQSYYMRIGNIEIIKDNSYLLNIDHGDKTVSVTPISGNQSPVFAPDLFHPDQMLLQLQSAGAKIEKRMMGNDTWLFLSRLPDPQMEECDICYDPQTWLIRRIWVKTPANKMTGTAASVMDVSYTYRLHVIAGDCPPVSKYMKEENRQPVLQKAYASYQLIN